MVERHNSLLEVPLNLKIWEVEAIMRNKAVLLVGKEGAKYELKRFCPILRGRFYISQGALFVWKSVWVANKDFPLELFHEMNKRMKWWREAGVPSMHSHFLEPPGGACFADSQRSSIYQFDNLRFKDLTGLFFTHLALSAVALAVFALELCLGRWNCSTKGLVRQ
ncbi:hypothetical protein V5799_014722 [Amblyomma americanum]|uniref:Uncharacterized protein n=1 Tax=Amblyomma americanum TaxID=6943 RepID=A0AAQ4E273_AMBAM